VLIGCAFAFNLATAKRVAYALEPYSCFWLEADILWDDATELARLRQTLPQRVASGETLHGRRAFREIIERQAVDVLQPDVKWTGGTHIFLDKKHCLYYPINKECLTMKRLSFGILASLMVIVFLGAMTKISFAEEGQWTKKADIPTARINFGTSVVKGKIYAIGGWDLGAIEFSTTEEYDSATDTWTRKADKPNTVDGCSTSAVNGKIYAIGGWDFGAPISTVDEYDPETDTWRKKADMPTGREYLSTSVVKGKIYAIGGSFQRALQTVEEYDPATDTWRKKADMPTGRFYFSTSVVNDKIYAIGGSTPAWAPLSTVEEYDPATNTWSKKADMPTARGALSTSTVNGKSYAIGGFWSPSIVEIYDPATDKWTKGIDIPTPKTFLSTNLEEK